MKDRDRLARRSHDKARVLGHQGLALIEPLSRRTKALDLATAGMSRVEPGIESKVCVGIYPSSAIVLAVLGFIVYWNPEAVRQRAIEAEQGRHNLAQERHNRLVARMEARARVEARTIGVIEPETIREGGMVYMSREMRVPVPVAPGTKVTQEHIDSRK